MRVAVYIKNQQESMRVANDVSRYLGVRHPEYYARIVNFDDAREFDTTPGSYSMDLYVLELNECDASDTGFSIAKRLRGEKANCALTFIVPTEAEAVRITREMLRPAYVFLRKAEAAEITRFMDDFLSRPSELSFIEFTFRYKKWLVNAENITYIQTCGDKTLIVCANTTLETTERLADLERRLPAHFFRVDKGCLINTRHLISADFTEQKAIFPNGGYVYMSRRGAKKLLDSLRAISNSEKSGNGEVISE